MIERIRVGCAALLALLLMGAMSLSPARAAEKEAARTQPVTIADSEQFDLHASANGERFLIKVKLPRGYADGDRGYPVLYVTDAETNSGAVSYIVQRLMKDELIPPLIVVGVAYGVDYDRFYELRSRDLTPQHVARWPLSGKASGFADFLHDDLFPYIGAHYRVKADDRALYGHSLGGLFGFYCLLQRPELFNRYLLLSPSLWWSNEAIFRALEGLDADVLVGRLYVGTGERENFNQRLGHTMVDTHRTMVERLQALRPKQLSLRSEILDDETHRTVFGRGFTNGLRFLYAGDASH